MQVLIGCDGVNSLVAKWLGLEKPSFTGRWAIRGFANCPGGHNFEPKLQQFFGNGTRAGFRPCDENIMVWFFTFYPSDARKLQILLSHQDRLARSIFVLPKTIFFFYDYSCVCVDKGIEKEADQGKLKQFVLDHLGKVPEEIRGIVEQTTVSGIICTPVKYRRPFDVLWKDKISKDNVCIAGDALHPMTPDIAQGACAALEDGVILARYLSEVFSSQKIDEELNDEKQYNEIKKCLIKYADERKWRSFTLMATSFTVGMIQQSSGFLADLLRDNGVSYYMSALLLKRGDFDCGRLLPY